MTKREWLRELRAYVRDTPPEEVKRIRREYLLWLLAGEGEVSAPA